MNWTSEKPNLQGRYLYRELDVISSTHFYVSVYVYGDGIGLMVDPNPPNWNGNKRPLWEMDKLCGEWSEL